jgi:DNA mismatch repair ATPase MutS
MEEAKEQFQTVSKNSLYFLVEKFNSNFILFKNIVQCIAELDCLISLAITSSKGTGGIMTRPLIKSNSSSSIKVKDMYHPSLAIK